MNRGKVVTIIGGSGFVGRSLVRQAVAAGYSVRVGCRHPQRAASLRVDGATFRQVDVATGRGVDDAVRGSTAVINLVGLLFESGRNSFHAAHVDGTERVVAACESHGVARYLHMSALGADVKSASDYARTKGEAEAVVAQSDLDWTIFRPSVIYGVHDSFLCRFAALSALAPIFPVIAAEMRLQPVWVEDVARAFVESIGHRRGCRERIDLAGPKIYSMLTLVEMTMAHLGRKRLLLPLPTVVEKVMAMVMQLLPTPLLTPDQLIMLQQDSVVDGDPLPDWLPAPMALEQQLPLILGGDESSRLQLYLDRSRQEASIKME
ncbi:MAG: complex I NDUFA9 subunit family protein [Mariprofundales bacterium]|nr:complex I NDUFA9 subunit family protein [Mariprofundales bacterium]